MMAYQNYPMNCNNKFSKSSPLSGTTGRYRKRGLKKRELVEGSRRFCKFTKSFIQFRVKKSVVAEPVRKSTSS